MVFRTALSVEEHLLGFFTAEGPAKKKIPPAFGK
jgi:hypothetical protein